MVENAFGILKHTFQEPMVKSDLHLGFLPDVVLTCAILHNIILGQSPEQIEELLDVLQREGMDEEEEEPILLVPNLVNTGADEIVNDTDIFKRHNLGFFLATRRRGNNYPW